MPQLSLIEQRDDGSRQNRAFPYDELMQPVRKDQLRHAVLTRRSTLSSRDRMAEDRLRTHHLLDALGETPRTIALYASRPLEPDTTGAITTLHAAGWRVLLPTLGAFPGWASFHGWDQVSPGWGGIPEPQASEEISLRQADVVVVACLAIARDGTRLGTGGGWYDRALPLRRHGVPVWALARTEEMCDELPQEAHDVAVQTVITEDGVFACGEVTVSGIGKQWPLELS